MARRVDHTGVLGGALGSAAQLLLPVEPAAAARDNLNGPPSGCPPALAAGWAGGGPAGEDGSLADGSYASLGKGMA